MASPSWLATQPPYVDMVFGPQTLHRLPDMLRESRNSGNAVVDRD